MPLLFRGIRILQGISACYIELKYLPASCRITTCREKAAKQLSEAESYIKDNSSDAAQFQENIVPER